jgi:hypothetical protein
MAHVCKHAVCHETVRARVIVSDYYGAFKLKTMKPTKIYSMPDPVFFDKAIFILSETPYSEGQAHRFALTTVRGSICTKQTRIPIIFFCSSLTVQYYYK